MQKKAFTIIELILVVTMLGLIFAMTRNFFNVSKQKKAVFGDNCINYIFAQVDKFQTDAKYGKLPTTLSGLDAVYNIYLFGDSTGTYYSSSGFAGLQFGLWSSDYSTAVNYTSISLSSNNFAPLNNSAIPQSCFDNGYTITAKPSIAASALQITIPTVKTNTSQWFIGEDWETNLKPQITGEVVYSVCGLVKGQTNPAWGSMLNTTECIEIGKITVDRRSESINFLRCAKMNEQTGKCGLRPRLN